MRVRSRNGFRNTDNIRRFFNQIKHSDDAPLSMRSPSCSAGSGGYKGSLFVALKGSWNRSIPTGYKVVRVPFKDGRPEGYYENFATGFWTSGEQRAEVWGQGPVRSIFEIVPRVSRVLSAMELGRATARQIADSPYRGASSVGAVHN